MILLPRFRKSVRADRSSGTHLDEVIYTDDIVAPIVSESGLGAGPTKSPL
jgi:hypothetical protein